MSALFKKKGQKEQQPQAQIQGQSIMQVNLVDVVKQASVQMKYEEIGSWLMMHKTPLFFCHEKGLSIVDRNFIDERLWLKKALNRLVSEIDAHRQGVQQKAQKEVDKQTEKIEEEQKEKTGYIG